MTPRVGILAILIGLLGTGCAEDVTPARDPVGLYRIDRTDYAVRLWQAGDPARAGKRPAAKDETWEAARKTAAGVTLRADVRADGTFVVSYRFGKERGTGRGAWIQDDDALTMRITHDAAGPVKRGASVTATIEDAGLRFEGWPVPHAFLLRRE